MNRPDPRTFVLYSYYLAFASSGVMLLTFLFALVPFARPLVHVMWLALITSPIGVFLGVTARSDFKDQEVEEALKRKMGIGIRVNLLTLIFIPVMEDDRLVAMMLRLDPKGDTGKRQVAMNVMLVVTVGEGNVRSGGTIAEVHAGDVVVLPGGLMHHIWTGPTGMDCILVTR